MAATTRPVLQELLSAIDDGGGVELIVNSRREFFYATPVEVRDALGDIAGSLLGFVEEPAADQFRESESMRAVGARR